MVLYSKLNLWGAVSRKINGFTVIIEKASNLFYLS